MVGLTIVCLVGGGLQLKNCIMFPSAPKGCSELMISYVITAAKERRLQFLTFSCSTDDRLVPVDNISGRRISFLSTIYHQIVSKASLSKRHSFRSKFGTTDRPLYIAYSPDAPVSLSAIKRLMSVFTH